MNEPVDHCHPRHRYRLRLRALLLGLVTREEVCTLCGGRDVRPTARRLPAVMSSLGLSPWRCATCDHRLVLRRAAREIDRGDETA